MARHTSLTHTLGSHISQRGQEEQAVLPSPCHRMDHHYSNASAPVERSPSHRVSPLELGHGAGPLLCPDGRAVLLAVWLRREEQTVPPQLREFCNEAEAKRGAQRQALAVDPCFVPLLRLVLSGWQGTPLPLALDATTWGLRFTVLAISVVYRGCAIPVAWTIVPANQPHASRREWLRILRHLRPASPSSLSPWRSAVSASCPHPAGCIRLAGAGTVQPPSKAPSGSSGCYGLLARWEEGSIQPHG